MVQIIGIIIAAVIAFLIGRDASKRGMNSWGWGIGVFLLLIVFLPLYFMVRKPKVIGTENLDISNRMAPGYIILVLGYMIIFISILGIIGSIFLPKFLFLLIFSFILLAIGFVIVSIGGNISEPGSVAPVDPKSKMEVDFPN